MTQGLFSRLGWLLGGGRRENDVKESIEDILEEEDTSDALSPKERAMLRNLLKFGSLKVADLMVPRADIVAVEVLRVRLPQFPRSERLREIRRSAIRTRRR